MLSDECRCHDDGCPDADICERYLQRDSGTVHIVSLFPHHTPFTIPCLWLIQADEYAQ